MFILKNKCVESRRRFFVGLAICFGVAIASPAAFGQEQGAERIESVQDRFPGEDWMQYADVADAGFSPERLAQAKRFWEKRDSSAFLVVSGGAVVASWGEVDRRFMCHSVRKSLLSALYGVYKADIDLELTLAELDIDDEPPLTDQEKQARIVDLISSRSGVYHAAAAEPDAMSNNRPARGSHTPGSHWWYNNWDFNTAMVVFEQETGERIFEAFGKAIAEPIGMQDYRVSDGHYHYEPDKSVHPAYPFRMSARDLARFGLLFARGGRWKDKQVMNAQHCANIFLLATGAWLTGTWAVAGEIVFPGAAWEHRKPKVLGLNARKLDQFVARIGGVGCIVKDGYMVKTWGNQKSKADWASAMKPVMSTMLSFAVKEGKLKSVDNRVGPYVRKVFPGKELIKKDRTMTFRHLANMVSGYGLPEPPGAAWGYNDYAINLYSKTLFDGVFRQTPNQAATDPKRLGALKFQDGSIFGSRRGYGLSTTPRDFARIGWFWLNKGNWNKVQRLPKKDFDTFLKPGVPGNLPQTKSGRNDYLKVYFTGGGTNQTPYGPGIYGFNWWFNAKAGSSKERTWPDAPADTFQANGHWNREVMTIIPSLKLVVAARGNWGSFRPGRANAGMNQNLKLLKEAVR